MNIDNEKFIQQMIEADKQIQDANNKVLEQVRGKVSDGAYQEILSCIEDGDWTFDYKIVSKPKGKLQDQDEFDYIDGQYVNQTTNGGYTGDEFAGTCSIKISDNEYFQFSYSM